jgi:hypothetical protein
MARLTLSQQPRVHTISAPNVLRDLEHNLAVRALLRIQNAYFRRSFLPSVSASREIPLEKLVATSEKVLRPDSAPK